MPHTDGVPTTVHMIKGPLSSWARSAPPSPQVGERAPVLKTNAPPTVNEKKRQRVELTIYDKREICRTQDSVKAIREKYGISRRTVYDIRATGILNYQKLINRDMGNQHRNRGFNTKGGDYNDPESVTYNKAEAMCEVHRACEKASSLWCPLTKSIVIYLIRQNTKLTSVSPKKLFFHAVLAIFLF